MKKTLVGLALALVFIPNVSFAQTKSGYEFLTPLVQTIISLLQDRITELQYTVAKLEDKIQDMENIRPESAPSCVGVVQSTSQVVTNPNEERVATIKAQIADVDTKLDNVIKERREESRTFELRGGDVTSFIIENHNKFQSLKKYEQETLQNERSSLYRQLDLLR